MIHFLVPGIFGLLSIYAVILSCSLYTVTGALVALALSTVAIVFRKPFALFAGMVLLFGMYASGGMAGERSLRIVEALIFGTLLFVAADVGFDVTALRSRRISIRSYFTRLKFGVETALLTILLVVAGLTLGLNSALYIPFLAKRPFVIAAVAVVLLGTGLYVFFRSKPQSTNRKS